MRRTVRRLLLAAGTLAGVFVSFWATWYALLARWPGGGWWGFYLFCLGYLGAVAGLAYRLIWWRGCRDEAVAVWGYCLLLLCIPWWQPGLVF